MLIESGREREHARGPPWRTRTRPRVVARHSSELRPRVCDHVRRKRAPEVVALDPAERTIGPDGQRQDTEVLVAHSARRAPPKSQRVGDAPSGAAGGCLPGPTAAVTRRLVERFRGAPDGSSGLRPIKSPLTAREWEVIDLLKPGHSPDEVAETLVLSPETVRSHVKNIMRKLEVHSRADAVAAAERLRIASPDAPS